MTIIYSFDQYDSAIDLKGYLIAFWIPRQHNLDPEKKSKQTSKKFKRIMGRYKIVTLVQCHGEFRHWFQSCDYSEENVLLIYPWSSYRFQRNSAKSPIVNGIHSIKGKSINQIISTKFARKQKQKQNNHWSLPN